MGIQATPPERSARPVQRGGKGGATLPPMTSHRSPPPPWGREKDIGMRKAIGRLVGAAVVAGLLSGCGASFSVYEGATNVKGIPVKKSVLYEVKSRLQASTTGGLCEEVVIAKFVPLPVGDEYMLNIKPGLFTKSEMKLDFDDNGSLDQVTLNSEPDVAETISAIGGLIKSGGGATAAALSTGMMPGDGSGQSPAMRELPPCNMGEKIMSYEKVLTD